MKIRDTKFTRIALIIFAVTAITVFGIQAFATSIPGTVITDTLVVGDTGYSFALADTNYLKGGHMQVADRAALLNTGTDKTVTLERRSIGMLVTVLDDDLGASGDQTITYRLFTNPSTPTTAITDWRAVLPDSVDGYNSGTNKYLTADASGNYSWGTPSATNGFIMTWPVLPGIALYGANAWGTSITDNSANWNTAYGWGDHANAGYLVSTSSAASLTDFPTFDQDTTGTAGGLTSAYIDWNALSGGASILNKPIISGSNTGDETTLSIQTKLGFASASTDGYLTSIDWNTFNGNTTYTNSTPTIETVHGITAGSTFSSQTMEDMFNRLLYPYIAPTVTLAAVPSMGVREFGDSVATVTLNATTTKKSNNITSVEFYRGASLIHTQVSPSPTGAVETYADSSTPVTTNGITFTAKAGDGTQTTTSNGVAYTFVYPFYHGVSVTPSLPNTGIASLTKMIQTVGTKTITETPSNEYMYFSYPSSYGSLTSIKDINNFETLSSWNTYTVTITGLDSNPISYKVYQSATTVVPSTVRNTFAF